MTDVKISALHQRNFRFYLALHDMFEDKTDFRLPAPHRGNLGIYVALYESFDDKRSGYGKIKLESVDFPLPI